MSIEYQPHQQRVIDKVNNPKGPHGIVAYHSLGSGKTLTALGAFDKALSKDPKSRGLFVVPASLVENVYKEIDKHKLNHLRDRLDVMSYERATNNYHKLCLNKYRLAAFDEAHRLRNSNTKRVNNLNHVIENSDKVLMLTGTAGYNHPSDMTSLINLINPKEKAPTTHAEFEKAYIDTARWELKNKDKLKSLLNKYIDQYKTPTNSKDFPSVTRVVKEVEMSPQQTKLYRLLERDIPSEIRSKLQKNLPMTLQDTTKLNVFAQGIRQASDSPMHHDISTSYKDSPKIMAAAGSMISKAKNTPGFRGVLYSNYIDAGIKPYTEALNDAGIKPLVFTGSLSQKDKKALVDEYNSKSKKPKVLILSSSGGEGLDLKNTQLMQLLEPHFNKSKLQQAEGRAIRFKSHEAMPKDKRHVLVEEYRSTLPRTRWQKFWGLQGDAAIDGYLAQASDRKQGIIDSINSML